MATLPMLALAGYGGFLLAAFGLSTLQAKRTTGRSPWRMPVSRADAAGELACLAGCLLSLAAPLLALAGASDHHPDYWAGLRAVTCIAAAVAAVSLALWAQRHLADEWRAGVDASASLVTTGPFARVRNPFYCAWILASAAVVAAVPSLVAVIALALHVAAAEIVVRAVEEPLLSRTHGTDYASYKQRTGRFLPRL